MGVIGVYFGYRNYRSSKRDIYMLHEIRKGGSVEHYRALRIIAFGHYRNDTLRLAKHSVVLAIGIISALLPNPSSRSTPTQIVVTVGLFVIIVLLILASALDRQQRENLEEQE